MPRPPFGTERIIPPVGLPLQKATSYPSPTGIASAEETCFTHSDISSWGSLHPTVYWYSGAKAHPNSGQLSYCPSFRTIHRGGWGLCWVCITALLSLFPGPLPPLLIQGCWPWEHPPISTLYADLHLQVYLTENPICDIRLGQMLWLKGFWVFSGCSCCHLRLEAITLISQSSAFLVKKLLVLIFPLSQSASLSPTDLVPLGRRWYLGYCDSFSPTSASRYQKASNWPGRDT